MNTTEEKTQGDFPPSFSETIMGNAIVWGYALSLLLGTLGIVQFVVITVWVVTASFNVYFAFKYRDAILPTVTVFYLSLLGFSLESWYHGQIHWAIPAVLLVAGTVWGGGWLVIKAVEGFIAALANEDKNVDNETLNP